MKRLKATAKDDGKDESVDYFIKNVSDDEPRKTVIDVMQLAEERFTPAYLYAVNRCRQHANTDPSSITTKEYWERHNAARDEFKIADGDTKSLWLLRSRQHLHRQPQISSLILAAVDRDPKRSWLGLESDIDFWCSGCTIRKVGEDGEDELVMMSG